MKKTTNKLNKIKFLFNLGESNGSTAIFDVAYRKNIRISIRVPRAPLPMVAVLYSFNIIV